MRDRPTRFGPSSSALPLCIQASTKGGGMMTACWIQQSRPGVVEIGTAQVCGTSGGRRRRFGRSRPAWVNGSDFGRSHPFWAESGPNLAEVGHRFARQMRSNSASSGSILDNARPMSVTDSPQCWPNSDRSESNRVEEHTCCLKKAQACPSAETAPELGKLDKIAPDLTKTE